MLDARKRKNPKPKSDNPNLGALSRAKPEFTPRLRVRSYFSVEEKFFSTFVSFLFVSLRLFGHVRPKLLSRVR